MTKDEQPKPDPVNSEVRSGDKITARDEAYDRIDRFLRNSLDDSDYADYSANLDLVYAAPASQAGTTAPAQPLAVLATFAHEVQMGAIKDDELAASAKLALQRAGLQSLDSVVKLSAPAQEPQAVGSPQALEACRLLVQAACVSDNSFIAPPAFAPAIRMAGAALRTTGVESGKEGGQ